MNFLLNLLTVYCAGYFVTWTCMALREWRRAQRGLKIARPLGALYQGADWFTIPMSWPFIVGHAFVRFFEGSPL